MQSLVPLLLAPRTDYNVEQASFRSERRMENTVNMKTGFGEACDQQGLPTTDRKYWVSFLTRAGEAKEGCR